MKTKQKNHIRILPVLLLLTGAVLFAVIGCSGNDAQTQPPEPEAAQVAVRVTKPVIRDVEHRLPYMGTVQSKQEVKVIARVSGTVAEMPFREGERVSRGDTIVRLDAPEIRAQVERLTADRDYWKRRHETDKRLEAKNALAPEQVDSSERAWKTAAAAVTEAESQLHKTIESAPFDGEILNWFVEPGQSVMPGQPLLLIGDDRLEIRTEVIEEDLRRGIAVGTSAGIPAGTGETVQTGVSEIAPIASGSARAFTVKLPVPDEIGRDLRKGSSVRVEFILDAREAALTVPANAVTDRDGDPHLFLVRDGRAVRQDIETGIEQHGFIVVSFPWNGEDPIAVSNIGSLKDGAAVYAVEVEEVIK